MKFTDQMGRELHFDSFPERVVSLVPSITEYLIDLGVNVVGRTKFCIHPDDKLEHIPIIGGTKNFRFSMIDQVQPDLIIGNKEENYQEGIKELEEDYPVWMTDIGSLSDTYEMMRAIGKCLNREQKAIELIALCEANIKKYHNTQSGSVLYLIWANPWMSAGRDTFINDVLSYVGYQNIIEQDRYPELTKEMLVQLNPNKILLSSEPFPFKAKHENELQSLLPDAELIHVDGEAFSWYGSRLAKVSF